MRPHADDFDGVAGRQHLIHKPVLNIDPAGIGPGKIADEFLKRRRGPKGVAFDDLEQQFRFGPKAGSGQLFGVFLRLSGKDKRPGYHLSLVRHFLMGVFSPFRIDARMPGIDSRWSVS